jgi:hypothetical protein
MTFFDDGSRDKLRMAVGSAMEAYAAFEASSASLIRVLLKANYSQSMAIYFAVKSSRDRLDLYEKLILLRLSEKNGQKFMPFWNSFTAYLQVMTKFRNAIAHWHPYVSLYEYSEATEGESKYRTRPSLGNPIPNQLSPSIYEEDIPPFVNDCRYASDVLTLLYHYFERKPRSLPDKFQRPIERQNQAVLRPPRNSKAPQPQRPPSTPKLSKKEKLAKALKDAREAAKRKASTSP